MAENQNSFIINKTYDSLLFKTIVRRYWWWIPILIISFFTIAKIYLRYTKPVYESQLVLQIESEDNAKNVLDIENINTKKDVFFSEVELLKSELLFNQAIKSLAMDVSIFYKGKILTEEKYKFSSFHVQPYHLNDSSLVGKPINVEFNNNTIQLKYFADNKEIEVKGKIGEHLITPHFDIVIKSEHLEIFSEESKTNEIYFTFNNIDNLTARFHSSLNIQPLNERARTILIQFRGDNPKICHDVSLAMANTFIEYSVKLKKKGSENILQFIDKQLDSLAIELKKSKDSLVDFQRIVKLSNPESNGVEIQSEANKFQEELFNIDDEIYSLRSISQKLQENPNRLDVYRILPELLGKSFEVAIANHIESLHLLLEDIEFRLTSESSEVRRIDKKIQEKIKQINKSILAIEERLKSRRNILNQKVSSLESEYSKLPEKRMEYGRLKNVQDLNEKYFQLLTEKKVQYAISDAGFSSSNRILQKPSIDSTPVEPRSIMIYLSFVVLGLIIGVMILFIKYVTFNEINLIEDLENILPENTTILGGIPIHTSLLDFSKIVVTESPKSIMAEALRKIRVNLSYIHPDYKTIAVTSSISGEGKTFVALNLAGIISMSGKKTILLDLDMRKPKVHLAFDLRNDKGMSNLIIGKVNLEEVIRKDVDQNLDIITSGPIPPNPSELLLSDRYKNLIEQLKSIYDVIIIDNPPIGLVSDGVKILTDADIPIYVFKSQYSKRNFVFRIKELFEMKQLTSLNIILNGVKYKKNVYGYGYNYGDNNGYIEEDKQNETSIKRTFFNRFLKKFNKKWK